jgi:hypothetical protein
MQIVGHWWRIVFLYGIDSNYKCACWEWISEEIFDYFYYKLSSSNVQRYSIVSFHLLFP